MYWGNYAIEPNPFHVIDTIVIMEPRGDYINLGESLRRVGGTQGAGGGTLGGGGQRARGPDPPLTAKILTTPDVSPVAAKQFSFVRDLKSCSLDGGPLAFSLFFTCR